MARMSQRAAVASRIEPVPQQQLGHPSASFALFVAAWQAPACPLPSQSALIGYKQGYDGLLVAIVVAFSDVLAGARTWSLSQVARTGQRNDCQNQGIQQRHQSPHCIRALTHEICASHKTVPSASQHSRPHQLRSTETL